MTTLLSAVFSRFFFALCPRTCQLPVNCHLLEIRLDYLSHRVSSLTRMTNIPSIDTLNSLGKLAVPLIDGIRVFFLLLCELLLLSLCRQLQRLQTNALLTQSEIFARKNVAGVQLVFRLHQCPMPVDQVLIGTKHTMLSCFSQIREPSAWLAHRVAVAISVWFLSMVCTLSNRRSVLT